VVRLNFALAACLVLSGCGGDGGTQGVTPVPTTPTSPTPTPTTAPTPTPTPTPTGSPVTTSEVKPTAGAAFLSATLSLTTGPGTFNQLTQMVAGGSTQARQTNVTTSQFALSYSDATGYHISDMLNAAAFGGANLISDTTKSSADYPTVLYGTKSPGIEDYFARYDYSVTSSSGNTSGTYKGVYGGIGVVNADSRQTQLDFFAFGPATPASTMPASGVVKFFLLGSGNYATDQSLFFVTEPTIMTVDFGAGTVSAAVGLVGHDFFNDSYGGVTAFRIVGKINGNEIQAPVQSDIATVSGNFHLLFVGPNADELIVTFVTQDSVRASVGSAVGVRIPG
jgi:hypothetical protein